MKEDFIEVNLSELKEWGKNPRLNDQAVDAVAKSIEEFDFQSPIIVQRSTMMVLAGHTRLKALKKLGRETAIVKLADLDDRQAERFAIADNQTGSIAEWDHDLLEEVLADFDEEDFEGLGFDGDFIQELLNSEEESSEEIPEELPKVQTEQTFELMKGNCLERLKDLDDGSIDSIVCDPPYEIDFMSKGWDRSGIAFNVDLWKECFRVLKAGGHIVAFSATRTIHGMTSAIEEAGFEIRDMIMWCYESGFPKSTAIDQMIDKKLGVFEKRKVIGSKTARMGTGETFGVLQNEGKNEIANIPENQVLEITEPYSPEAKKYRGWGSALKPAYEPAVLARKPLIGSLAENVLEHGTGGINIDSCRFAFGDPIWFGSDEKPSDVKRNGKPERNHSFSIAKRTGTSKAHDEGRFPANIVRFKKAHRSEREHGLQHLPNLTPASHEYRHPESSGLKNPRAGSGRTMDSVKNIHPTVKPVDLMRWLVRLVTPKEGIVLDPFLGSGTTAVSAILEGFSCIGIELTPDYYPIIEGRVEQAKRDFKKMKEEGKEGNE